MEVFLQTFLNSTLIPRRNPPLHIECKSENGPEAGLSTREGKNFIPAEIETR
jgi:hypothetical protein